MMRRVVAWGARAVVMTVLVGPGIAMIIALDRPVAEIAGDGLDLLVAHSSDLRGGRITESLVVTLCVAVMVAAWLRIVWVAIVLVVGHWRGWDPSHLHRPAARILLRVLLLAPVALHVATPRATADSGSALLEAGRSVESRTSSKEVLLVSIAVAVGVSWRLRRERSHSVRTDEAYVIDDASTSFESEVVRHGDDVAFERLERVVRSCAMAEGCRIRWLVHHRSGLIHVECEPSAVRDEDLAHRDQRATHVHREPWKKVSDRVHRLDAEMDLTETGGAGVRADVRLPILLPVGLTDAGEVWVNVESVGRFTVEGRDSAADAVWDGLCQSLALSPWHSSVHVISDLDNTLQGRRQLLTHDIAGARDIAAVLHSSESPSVLLVSDGDSRSVCVHGARDESHTSTFCGLQRRGETWYLMPMQSPIYPTTCRPQDRSAIVGLIGNTSEVVRCRSRSNRSQRADLHRHARDILAEVSFVVRVMGRPCVEHVDGGEVSFERSRSEELVVWLALHPDRRRRSTARAEMWNVPVKDATFSNVTSDVRRSLTAQEMPPTDEQWLSATLTDEMPLHRRIVTDVSLLASCLEHARRDPDDGGADLLAFGLGYVRGCPLEGSRYLWRDTTGISTQIALLIVRAATMCAEMALDRGDVEGLYWSTSQGLMAVPGHEGLVALRMRQHAHNGDTASLSAEWEAYCRSLTTDDWGDARPSPKMVDLWFTLSGASRDVQ